MVADVQRKKVLVVEDDTLLSSLLSRKLSETYEILYAPTGEAALDILSKSAPDLILLDVVLPGMDGFEVLRRIKADPKTAGIHVVILSNLSQDEDIAKGKQLGADQYVVKVSLTLDEIVQMVGSVIQKPPAAK